MSQVLVVTYSLSGTSLRLAQRLCRLQGWKLAQVRDHHPRVGLRGTWRCVLDSLLRRRPPISYTGPAPRDFDLVVLVSPIWAQQLAGPMRSFVAEYATGFRNIAVISVMSSRGAPNAVAEIGRIVHRSPLLSTAFTTREVDDGSCHSRLEALGATLRTASSDAPAVRPAEWSSRTA